MRYLYLEPPYTSACDDQPPILVLTLTILRPSPFYDLYLRSMTIMYMYVLIMTQVTFISFYHQQCPLYSGSCLAHMYN